MAIIPFPTDILRLHVRRLARSEDSIAVAIRFRRHDDPADVEEVRWNIQGNIQRRGGIPRAKGFKLRECALARSWFEFDLEPKELPRFVHEILPYIEDRHVIVLVDAKRLTNQGLRVTRTA